ncbi:hemolymph lipopolysaccharide-binding protein-like [Periplaneta americana]|uniref:hemolymph lipopolysaccharide-binding protein-like n=1 Tax=Periplaneta americana TaxID=6978 RepID=UPI0037E8F02C
MSLRNETGHWVAQLQLGHDACEKSAGPYEVDIDHMAAKCEDSESILISAKIAAAPSTTMITQSKSPKVPTVLGYELVPGQGYYKLHTDVNTWHGAKMICEEEGAHLMVINSEKEVKSVKPILDKNSNIAGGVHTDWIWIGFHDLYDEGKFVTIFNDTLESTGYVNWGGGEGSGGKSENCGLLHQSLLLADYPCNAKDGFLCEIEL